MTYDSTRTSILFPPTCKETPHDNSPEMQRCNPRM
jgi:hypothetical protein